MLNLLALAASSANPEPTPNWWNELALAIVAVTPIVTRVAVWASFYVVDHLPKWAIPIIAVTIGSAIDYFSGLALANPALAALATLGAMGLQQIVKRWFLTPLGLTDRLTVADHGDTHIVWRKA